MKQSEFLKSVVALTPYQRRMLDTFMLDALNLNEEDTNTKPDICPYCKKHTAMIKKAYQKYLIRRFHFKMQV